MNSVQTILWVWRQELQDMTSEKGQHSVGCEKKESPMRKVRPVKMFSKLAICDIC